MHIKEIITEGVASEMALMALSTSTREFSAMVDELIKDAKESIKREDPTMLLPSYGRMSKWFTHNYISSKGGTGAKLNSALQALKTEKAFRADAEKALSAIKFNMDRDKKQSSVNQIATLFNSVSAILNKARSTNYRDEVSQESVSKAKHLQRTLPELRELLAQLSAFVERKSKKHVDAKTGLERDKKKKKNTIAGQQNAQVDAVVNQVLATIPPDIAGKIRNDISRADNKLQALQAAMKKYGLAESIKLLKTLLRG